MKKSAKNRIIIWSVVSVILIGILVIGICNIPSSIYFGSSNFRFIGPFAFEAVEPLNEDEIVQSSDLSSGEYDADEIRSVIVKWRSGRVNIKVCDGGNVSFYEEGRSLDSKPMTCRVTTGGNLELYSPETMWFFNFFSDINSERVLTVLIPDEKILDRLIINTASAEISVEDIKAQKTTLESISGSVTANKIRGSEMSLSSVSGSVKSVGVMYDDVSINNVSGNTDFLGQCVDFDAQSVSGDITASLSDDARKVDIETVSGGADVKLPKEIKGFTADFDTTSGNMENSFSSKTDKGRAVYGDGSTEIDVDTVSGDFCISKD